MKKVLKQLFRNGLCGILCAAMVLTSLSVPEMEVYAAQNDMIDENELTGEANEEAEAPEAEDEDTDESDSVEDDEETGGGYDVTPGEDDTDTPETEIHGTDDAEADEEEAPEDENSINALKVSADYGELQNGDFETNWGDGWTVNWDYTKIKENDAHPGKYVDIWTDGGTQISLSQVVENIKSGVYVLSLDKCGDYPEDDKDPISVTVKRVNNDDEHTDVDATPLVKQSLGAENNNWSTWNTISTKVFLIEVPSGEEQVNIEVAVEGTLSASKGIHLDNVVLIRYTYSFEEMKQLIKSVEEYKEEEYTPESWEVLDDAQKVAKALVEEIESATSTEDEKADDITLAYLALEKAINELESVSDSEEPTEITLYYYVDDVEKDEDVVVANWTDSLVNVNAEVASWQAGGMTTYQMEKVKNYLGWYSISLEFPGEDSDASGFEIYKGNAGSSKVLHKLGKTWEDNTTYATLASGDYSAYAIKNYKCYSGSDMVTAIMRNVTLYVYSTDDVPALMVENGGTLTKVDEDSAAVVTIDPDSYDDGYGKSNHYYSMTKDSEVDNWYYLTLTAPDVSGKMFGLYTKVDKDAWSTDFVNGPTGNKWETDFTPVFEGNVYYKDGEFLSSRSITLGALKALLEEAKAIQKNGQGGYTQASWSALETAIAAAGTAISKLDGKDDSYTDDEAEQEGDTTIATTYANLEKAIKGLEIGITFYYYAGTGATAAGLTFWSNDAENPFSTDATLSSSWHGYGGSDATYLMTTLGNTYPGWYEIKLSIKNNGGKDSGFAVHKWDGKNTSELFNCSKLWNSTEIYAQLTSGSESAYAIKNRRCYAGQDLIDTLMRNVTIYVYDNAGIPAIGTTGELFYVDEKNIAKNTVEGGKEIEGNRYYDMLPDEENTNWYCLTFSAPKADGTSGEIAGLYRWSEEESQYTLIKTFVEGTSSSVQNPIDFTPVFKGSVYYQDGKFYDTRPATIDDLMQLVADAQVLKEDELSGDKEPRYKHEDDGGAWSQFLAKLESAEELLDKDAKGEKPSSEDIANTYSDLKRAMGALVPIPISSDSISVERVAVDEDFITGADLSSYVSLRESGVVFKDRNGKALSDSEFFKYLYEGGTNWVRVRVWNDPYNSTNGGGYGGGNSDLEKAKLIGKLATEANMKVLIDFHYSDFWADPAKQAAPKEWQNYSLDKKTEEVYKYTLESLEELRAAGVDVCMVQVGNETNNGICGENSWANMAKIFNAGSEAVREFDPECLVAIHFAEPQDNGFVDLAGNLDKYGVDYDVFASSYYPFWHGDTTNLKNKLSDIAKSYGKKVMVAETSWVTTWEDGDGHGNSAPKITQELNYAVSLQGQADEIRDVMAHVAAVNDEVPGAAIGMFYWEPAWISPYYVYNADGSVDQSLYKKNQELWEKYGSGWASSYSIEYDPTDAGLWYGGSAVDNQAWFDFDGKALETAQIYKYIRTAANAQNQSNAISTVQSNLTMEVKVGEEIVWPDKVDVTFNNGRTFDTAAGDDDATGNPITELTVKWDEEQVKLVNTDKAGRYPVAGIVKCTYKVGDDAGSTTSEAFNITLTIDVISAGNILKNEGFEDSSSDYRPWEVKADHDTSNISVAGQNQGVRSGYYGLHFWGAGSSNEGIKLDFTAEQKVENIEPGVYTFGGYIQGGGAADTDLQYAYVKVYGENDDEPKVTYQKSCTLGGYLNWMNPEITGVKVSKGDYLVVGMHVTSSIEGAWGTIDDMYLYGSYGIDIDSEIKNGKVTVNNLEADNNDVIRITATPNNGYYLSELTVSGTGVTGDAIKLQGDGGTPDTDTVSEGKAVLKFNEGASKSYETMTASFNMPNTAVTISAKFASVFSAGKISLVDVTVEGFTEQNGKCVYDTEQEYTGKNIELDLKMTYGGYKLTTADYTVSYSKNKSVTEGDDMAVITVKAKTSKGAKFEGSRTLYFKIVDTKFDISKAKIIYGNAYDDKSKQAYYYTGDYIELGDLTFTDKGGNPLSGKDNKALSLKEGTDYTVTYLNNIKVGKATIMVIAKDSSKEIKGSVTQTFTIAKRPISGTEITISEPSGGTYTGGKITPNVTVKYGNTVLQKGKDYKVTYYNNTNVCTDITQTNKPPYLKITGIGNFTGSTDKYNGTDKKITFKIYQKSIKDFSVTASAGDLIHNNKNLALKLTVKDGKKSLSANKQYRVSRIERTDIKPSKLVYEYDEATGKAKEGLESTAAKVKDEGTYQVTLKGLGSYADERTLTFRVVGADHILSNAKINKIGNQVYTGSPIKLDANTLIVTDKNGEKLTAGKEYTATYTNNIKAGTATVTITAKSESGYAGSKSATFKIVKRTIANGSNLTEAQEKNKQDLGLITLRFAEEEELYKVGDEYLYPYTGYNWTPNLKVFSVNHGVEKPLTNGVDYTISFKNNQKANDKLEAGKYASVTITGKGSYSGKATFKDVFKVKDVTLDKFEITINPVTYTGKAIKPALTFVYKETGTVLNLKAGTAYSVKYKNNTKAASLNQSGTTDKNGKPVDLRPQVLITEKGLRAYTTDAQGKIVTCPAAEKAKDEAVYFTITTGTITSACVTDIKPQTYNGKPAKPAVTVKVNGRKLKAGTDYIVTYRDNVGRNSAATAAITGIGNYSGQVDKTFVIK